MISIVISMYNSNRQVLEAIEHLLFPSLIQNGGEDKELILVDDASPLKKETEELVNRFKPALTKAFQSVTIHQNEHNLGFGKSYNLGVGLAHGEYILIANSDVYFPKDSISHLVKTLESDTRYGLVGPVTNASCGYQNTHLFKYLKGYSATEIKRLEDFAFQISQLMTGKVVETDGLIGFCLAVKTSVFMDVGGFDMFYGQAGSEDFDLVRKVRQKYKTVLDCSVFVEHGGKGPMGHTLSVGGSGRAFFNYQILAPLKYSLKWHDPWSYFRLNLYRTFMQYFLDKDTVTSLILKEAKKKNLSLPKS